MACRPGAHPFSWLPAGFLGLTLVACGGGGGGGADTPGANGSAGVGVHPNTFIAPAGPLCAQRTTHSHCLQPTSSSTTSGALIKAITDPSGQTIDFDSMGFIQNYTVTYQNKGTRMNIPEFTYSSYGMARRSILAGRNAFTVDGSRHYEDAKAYPAAGDIKYRNGRANASITLNVGREQDGVPRSPSISEDQTIGSGGSLWVSALTRLTDQIDAPQTKTVTYVGRVVPLAGSGAKLDEHTRDILSTGVTYEAVLDITTGKLTGVSIDHTEAKSQRHTRLKLPELRFENSRLDKDSRQERIHGQMQGPGEDSRSGAPLPDTVHTRQEFITDGLEGEITGKQAEFIELVGGGPKGSLRVVLMRKDRAGNDFVVDVPMEKQKP